MFVCEGHRVKVKITGTKSLSVCLIRALTFECFLLECYFWCASTHSECLKSDSYIKVIGPRSRSQEQKTCDLSMPIGLEILLQPVNETR